MIPQSKAFAALHEAKFAVETTEKNNTQKSDKEQKTMKMITQTRKDDDEAEGGGLRLRLAMRMQRLL